MKINQEKIGLALSHKLNKEYSKALDIMIKEYSRCKPTGYEGIRIITSIADTLYAAKQQKEAWDWFHTALSFKVDNFCVRMCILETLSKYDADENEIIRSINDLFAEISLELNSPSESWDSTIELLYTTLGNVIRYRRERDK